MSLTRANWEEIWKEILKRRGLKGFMTLEIAGKSYVLSNFKVREPDGSEREETWLLNFQRESISPSGISGYESEIQQSGHDMGLVITAGTLTTSAASSLTSSRHVRVYDQSKFMGLLREEPEIARKYGIPVYERISAYAKDLLERLENCPRGIDFWKRYERLIEDIFRHIFVPPLAGPKPQKRAEDGLEIRDLVFPNRVETGFWGNVRSDYKGSYVAVEAKNKSCGKNDVIQLGDYLVENQLGLFGILCSRETSDSANQQRRKVYSTSPHKMIVLINDDDIREMILKRSRGENPEEVLYDRIDLYRMDFRF